MPTLLTAEDVWYFCYLSLKFIPPINIWKICIDLRLFSKYLRVPFLRPLRSKFFLDYQFFFSLTKVIRNFFFVHSVFYVLKSKKKIQSDPKNFQNFFFQNLLNVFWKTKKFKKFRIAPNFFFAFQYIKIWTKVAFWTKKFCSWKKVLLV